MCANKAIIDNILSAGYLREHEEDAEIEIPDLVTNIISVYCKEYYMKTIGSRELNKLEIMDATNSLNILKSGCVNFDVFISNSNNVKDKSNYPFEHASVSVTAVQREQIDDIMINTDDKVVDIQSGDEHTLFLTSKGNVYGIGKNDCGQLGFGKYILFAEVPTLIPLEHKIKKVACGGLHSLFITRYGKLLVCGYNSCGQLGIDSQENESVLSESVTVTESSDDFWCSDDSDTEDESYMDELELYCVYTPIYNQYFDELNITFIDICCGRYHSLCITTNGDCFTFGHNGFANLGNGKQSKWGTVINIPYKLEMNKKFKSGSCGENHNILTTDKNELVVFGDNRENQCSIMKQNQFETPYILSKQKEIGVSESCFIEKVISVKDKSIVIIDIYKRHL